MPSPRKHPSRYPSRFSELLQGPSITLTLPTTQHAERLRYALYAFRESLRTYPEYDVELLVHANEASLSLRANELHIEKPQIAP